MVTVVLLVCLTVCMLLWLLSLLGAVAGSAQYSPWLAWFSVLFLTLLVLFGRPVTW
jgi:hypothetical protein